MLGLWIIIHSHQFSAWLCGPWSFRSGYLGRSTFFWFVVAMINHFPPLLILSRYLPLVQKWDVLSGHVGDSATHFPIAYTTSEPPTSTPFTLRGSADGVCRTGLNGEGEKNDGKRHATLGLLAPQLALYVRLTPVSSKRGWAIRACR
jgi:hypothetical protein